MPNITLTVNGEKMTCTVAPDEKLLDTLRRLGRTDVKKGCGEGTCGSCSVLIDGRLMTSCIVFSARVDGAEIMTAAGLGTANAPHPIQTSFVKAGAVQCGFCTPGMVLATKALLDAVPKPDVSQIKMALDGNMCRCTGYVKIIEAVQDSARVLAGENEVPHE